MENKEDNNDAGPLVQKTPDFMAVKKEFIIFLSNDNKTEYILNL